MGRISERTSAIRPKANCESGRGGVKGQDERQTTAPLTPPRPQREPASSFCLTAEEAVIHGAPIGCWRTIGSSFARTAGSFAESGRGRGRPRDRRSTTPASINRAPGTPVSHPSEHKSRAGDPGLPPQRAQIARRGPRSGGRRYFLPVPCPVQLLLAGAKVS